jgi:hypothetical protein
VREASAAVRQAVRAVRESESGRGERGEGRGRQVKQDPKQQQTKSVRSLTNKARLAFVRDSRLLSLPSSQRNHP